MDGRYARVMNWLWNVLVLSILWLVCSLPVLTLGASSTAAYYAASKVIRHKTGRIHQEFFSSFHRNLRQSLPLTLVVELLAAVIGMECLYLYSDSRIPIPVICLFAAMLLAVLGCGSYLWACLSRFDRGSLALFRMSVVLQTLRLRLGRSLRFSSAAFLVFISCPGGFCCSRAAAFSSPPIPWSGFC